jgi:hypothetical protein
MPMSLRVYQLNADGTEGPTMRPTAVYTGDVGSVPRSNPGDLPPCCCPGCRTRSRQLGPSA